MSNVVLVTVDSLRADHVGHYGYERDTTPTVDALATDGASFDAYANATWTRASFPSILTSTYPLEYGGFEYLADERTTVGEAVGAVGHTTGGFHSNLWLSRDYNYDRGFDRFYDSKSDPSALARLRTWLKLNLNHDGFVYRTLQRLYDTTEERAGLDVGQTYKDAETLTDEVCSWLVGVDDPFFCWVHYMDVHHPYVPRREALDGLGLDVSLSERQAIQLRRRMLEEPEAITDEELQTLVDLYDGEIRYMDGQIGRIVDLVDEQFDEETAVVVTADHGDEFREHGRFSHPSTFYDEVLHVPFVVGGADGPLAEVLTGHHEEILELLDVAPTCCALAGAPIPDGYRGRSALDAAGSGEDARVVAETTQGADYKLAVRTRDWKYIWDREAEDIELYDLQADPGERTNLAGDRTHEEIESDLQEKLIDHLNALRETNTDLPEVAMDAETEERLKNLGYLE